MKVLLVINSIRVSGSEKLMIALSKQLGALGYQFWLCPLITPFDNEFRKSIEDDGHSLNILLPRIIVLFENFIWRLNGLTTRLFNWSIRTYILKRHVSSYCRKAGIQLMVSNSYTTDLFTLDVHKRTRIPYVVVEHGSYASMITQNSPFDDQPVKQSVSLVAVSRWTQQLLEARFPERQIDLIYNAWIPGSRRENQSLEHLRPVAGRFTFCMHGRDTEQKGWELAIKSILKLNEKGYNARLILLSAGPYIEKLKSTYAVNSAIIFGGFVYNIDEAISYVDAGLVLSKQYEAFGLSILDYFHGGKPVVAGRVGGIPEVVEAGDLRGGILVAADSGIPRESEIIEAMQSLIDNKELYSSLAADGRRIVREFTMGTCAAKYDQLFKSVMQKF